MNGYEAMRDWYKGRIAALEAENAALKEEVKEQDEREAKWAKRFDQQIGHFAVRLYNSRKMRILIARRRISALRNENAALKERWEKALSEAREAAGHEFGLWPLGAAAITHQLREENAALREDKARLDDMERLGISLICRKSMPSSVENKWLAKRDESHPEKTIRAAIDAARKEAACPRSRPTSKSTRRCSVRSSGSPSKRSKRKQILAAWDPYQNIVRLEADTWEAHILPGHEEMEGCEALHSGEQRTIGTLPNVFLLRPVNPHGRFFTWHTFRSVKPSGSTPP